MVGVKSKPNRVEYIGDLKDDIKKFFHFFPEYNGYKLIPIYAGLNMAESTINKLTKEKIYAMVVKGDILEIVNLKEVGK